MSDAVLPDIPVSAIDNPEEQFTALTDLRNRLEELLDGAAITDISNTAAAISGAYVQAEVQQIANDVETVSDKLDLVLAALRTAKLIGE